MKRPVLWMTILLCASSYTWANPFAIEKNLKKIEVEEKMLLSDLKVVADKQEALEDAEYDEEDDEDEAEEVQKPMTPPVAAAGEKSVTEEENSISTSAVNVANEAAAQAEEERLKKVKEDQERLDAARLKQQQEKEALETLAAETLAAEKTAIAAAEAEKKRVADELARLEAEKAKLEAQFAREEAEKAAALEKAKAAKKAETESVAKAQVDAEKSNTAATSTTTEEKKAKASPLSASEKEAILAVNNETPAPKKEGNSILKPKAESKELSTEAQEAYKKALKEVD